MIDLMPDMGQMEREWLLTKQNFMLKLETPMKVRTIWGDDHVNPLTLLDWHLFN